MTEANASSAQEASISIVVIRADGTREDLGVVSYWHRNPLKRLQYRLRHRGVGKITMGDK